MDWFARTGERVGREWALARRDEEAFPAIARAALVDDPPLAGFDLDAFARDTLDPERPLAKQFAPAGVFGQPGVTGFDGVGLLIDVYFWTSGLSAIHDHPFCGLFTILRGFSVHSIYRFESDVPPGARARIGTLALQDVEVLVPGDHRLFSLRTHPLIHSLIHVPNPSVSLVIRTKRSEGYHRYLPPSVALRVGDSPPHLERRLALLDFLRRSGDPAWEVRTGEFLASHDFDAAFAALTRVWPEVEIDVFRRLVDLGRMAHGAAMDLVERTVARAWRRIADERIRERFSDPDGRFVATVLAQAERRPRVLALLRARYGDDLTAHLEHWLDAAGLFESDSPGWHVAHMLVQDPLPPGIVTSSGLDPGIERYFRGSILEALLP